MKKLQTLTLSMLLLTAGITLQAKHHSDHDHHFTEENYDQQHHLNKDRNDNDYDGSKISTFDEHDAYDTAHHLDKHRTHHEHDRAQNQQNTIERKKMNAASQKMMPAKKKATTKNQKTQTWAEYFDSLI